MTWDARKIITRIPEASGRTGTYAESGRKFVLADDGDNQPAIRLVYNQKTNNFTKHIAVVYRLAMP